jgi:hypothetical protein
VVLPEPKKPVSRVTGMRLSIAVIIVDITKSTKP